MFAIIRETIHISLAQAGAEDVKRHKWFKGVDWEDVYYRFVTFSIIIFYKLTFSSSSSRFKGVDLGFLLWVLSPTSKELFVTE